MKVSIRATVHLIDDPQRDQYRPQPVVELWVGGIRFVHRCSTSAQARAIAERVARDLGIAPETE